MAWYYGTFACGHDGRVNVVGPIKDRQWKVDNKFSKMCPECYEKYLLDKRELANAEAAEKAKEMELPKLTGTPKQTEWANTIRQKRIEELENESDILEYMYTQKTTARWYIDTRDEYFKSLSKKLTDEMKKVEAEKEETVATADIKMESTVFPENAVYKSAVEINYTNDKISARFEKNDDFRRIVKSLGYSWNGVWEKKLSEYTGTGAERAAELGNKLLNAGIPVTIYDEEVRYNAIQGKFEPECKRWIRYRTDEKKFAIRWQGKNDDLYNMARRLKGSRWNNGAVTVTIEHFREVEDFAQAYGFKFSKTAIEAIESFKEGLEKALVVKPVKVEKKQNENELEKILQSSDEVLEDLREDD